MNSIDLGGHSGCKIKLFEVENGCNFVRKVSRDESYNIRLEKQCEKQVSFTSSSLRTPKVLQSGYNNDGLFYFDMEYIQGITLAEYIRNMEIGKVRSLVKALVEHIGMPSDNTDGADPNLIFEKKIFDLKQRLNGMNCIVDNALDLLEHHDWSLFLPSVCHGDLTLENIIIKNDELYLIDFLDSFYDSYLIDLGTLMQDIQTMWSYRHEEKADMNLVLRLIVFRDLLVDSIRRRNEHLVCEVYYSLLQKLIRILPYTKDVHTSQFLIDKIALVSREVVCVH